jgi:hypothetical protein
MLKVGCLRYLILILENVYISTGSGRRCREEEKKEKEKKGEGA